MGREFIRGSGLVYSKYGLHRPASRDLSITSIVLKHILQPKYDGWYVEGKVENDIPSLDLHSTSYAEVDTIPIGTLPPAIIRGEFIYGTYRAKRSSEYLCYRVYDLIVEAPYVDRYKALSDWVAIYQDECKQVGVSPRILLTPCYGPENFTYLMEQVKSGELEGVIGRNPTDKVTDAINRFKPRMTIDYIVLGFDEGQGRLSGTVGAIIGGQIKDGKLIEVCKVSGLNDKLRDDMWANPNTYIGKVFEVEGNQVFESGAVRHPRFRRWRVDIKPADVIWKGDQGGRFVE